MGIEAVKIHNPEEHKYTERQNSCIIIQLIIYLQEGKSITVMFREENWASLCLGPNQWVQKEKPNKIQNRK